jgi:hypothetical protein
MHPYRMSFKKKGHASIFWNSREYCIYGPVFDCMLGVRAPCVRYVSLQELVRLFVGVLEAYNREIDDVLRDIWDKRRNKKWSAYDRLMLGIFCFDEVILSTVERIHLSTKKRGAIYACLAHREICKLLNEANRTYIHATQVPDRDDLLRLLQTVSTNAIMMGSNSLMMCVMRQNIYRCTDIRGDAWLLCPKHALPAYILALCMGQHGRLGASSELLVMPTDIIRLIVNRLFAKTSWDSNPLDSKVEVGVPV